MLELVGEDGDGKALVLAFRGTGTRGLADFQADFGAVPQEGKEKGAGGTWPCGGSSGVRSNQWGLLPTIACTRAYKPSLLF